VILTARKPIQGSGTSQRPLCRSESYPQRGPYHEPGLALHSCRHIGANGRWPQTNLSQ
jgi:hypothetical protein